MGVTSDTEGIPTSGGYPMSEVTPTYLTVVGSVCLSMCLLMNISPLERLFFLKIISHTQWAAKVKKWISLKQLHYRDTPLPALYGYNRSAILYARIKCMR